MLDTLAPPKPIPSSPASALKVGVLLLNLGGPETSADVEGRKLECQCGRV